MSNGLDLRASRSVELLDALESKVADFAKREEQLQKELRTQRNTVTQKHQVTIDQAQSRLDQEVAEAQAHLEAESSRLKRVYERRRARVERSHLVLTRHLPRRVREVRESWLGELQMRRFRLERQLESSGVVNPEFTRRLATYQSQFTDLLHSTRDAFAGSSSFINLIRVRRKAPLPGPVPAGEEAEWLNNLQAHLAAGEKQLDEFKQFPLPKLFAKIPLTFFALGIILIGLAALYGMGLHPKDYSVVATGCAVAFASVWIIHLIGMSKVKPLARELAASIKEARFLQDSCRATVDSHTQQGRGALQDAFDREVAEIEEQKLRADDVALEFEERTKAKLAAQYPRLLEKIDLTLASRLARVESEQSHRIDSVTHTDSANISQLRGAQQADVASLEAGENARWHQIEAEWKSEITPIYDAISQMNSATAARFPQWHPGYAEGWKPPTDFTPATRFAQLEVDLTRPTATLPKDPRLALPGPSKLSIPLSLSFPYQGSLLFETNEPGGTTAIDALNNIILRLLATTPPGKLSFTIIDPVGLGQSFAGLMHLSDYEETLINRRIWTQRDQIEERLAELSEHIEKVIQMYLRNEYATITEYNEQAGSVAEKYHFLVIADFPVNFSETAAKRLQSIATSGPRCGIYTLIHWDQRHPLPDGFTPDELRQNSICLRKERNGFVLANDVVKKSGATLVFDAPPNPDLAVQLVHRIGKSSIDSNIVQVPFSQIAPPPGELWAGETTNELRIAIGRTGATKLQYLAIGKGTRQHALFAGKTGSGKSTLFHVIITNLALTCSPEEVEFYLIDFKKGVEFKCYASKKLPHAKVVAIESDREFALSVLQRVDGELKRRGDMFRKLGVQDVAGYKRAGGTEPMPRSLLLIDEFQEFFVDDDTIAQTASLLFDRIVRQGRAFGIHVLLGSQTLGGAYSLARATLGQMVIRVALQCNEADAYLIMDENNAAPRLLTRPGEGIYNDAAGAMEGNSPFQVVWLGDDERDEWLDKVHDLAVERGHEYTSPIVFEGNAPADLRENQLLRFALDTKPANQPLAGKAWMGAPNSIKGPTEAAFHRQSGNHLLIVGQRDEAALTLLGTSLLSLAAQYPVGGAKFVVLHGCTPGTTESDFIERAIAAVPHEITVSRGQDIGVIMSELSAEMKARTSGEVEASRAPAVFLLIHGLHKYKKLRQEDDFSFSMSSDDEGGGNPGTQFVDLITEGSPLGMHVLTTVDTFNNVNRSLSRKALSEFEMRVVFQMSANDSASLIDSPKASNLGLHRALFYNEHEGTLETFRPYAMPDAGWIEEAGQKMK
ncbi:FtsK/SpoIIIE domain-containing protein [Verrucomicrobium sp. BvORR106]|uniref:FtsK/SpoIIIE domain-containing protein n=1 Tax=Verrucomicrobium sp. BvORR106 TaxID=1403819 RepID=UPI00056DBF17|nr:FtsK/SpoIIIE domain-containing protein [Verrucomicrobium sp. BvORR106]